MANRRMLSVNIRKSRKLAKAKTDFARLCWTWALPFTDDYGRFEAEPEIFKATAFPLIKSATEKRIADAMTELSEVGLIILYEVGGILYGEITKFDEFQTFKSDRVRKAECPPSDQGNVITGIQWNPVVSKWNPKLVELKGSKGKLREEVLAKIPIRKNLSLQKLNESFPIYQSINDDALQSLSQEFPTISIDTVLGDLLAWEQGNKKPTTNPALRLRNFCKTAAKQNGGNSLSPTDNRLQATRCMGDHPMMSECPAFKAGENTTGFCNDCAYWTAILDVVEVPPR